MGITDLSKLIKLYAPHSIVKGNNTMYFKRRMGVDISAWLYQIGIAIRGSNTELIDNGVRTGTVKGIMYKVINLYEVGILPVLIFDGPPPPIKQDEIDRRKKKVKEATEKMKVAKDETEKNKYFRRSFRLTSEEILLCKELLYYMGVPYVNAPHEAEAQACYMTKHNVLWGVISEDMDCLAFQGKQLITKLKIKNKKIESVHYEFDKVLEKLDLTKEQFIDMCILLKCDYCEKIKGLGHVKVYELIKKYDCIERVVKHLPKNCVIPDDFDFDRARQYFLKPDIVNIDKCKWSAPNSEYILRLLCEKYNFDEVTVIRCIDRLEKATDKLHIV